MTTTENEILLIEKDSDTVEWLQDVIASQMRQIVTTAASIAEIRKAIEVKSFACMIVPLTTYENIRQNDPPLFEAIEKYSLVLLENQSDGITPRVHSIRFGEISDETNHSIVYSVLCALGTKRKNLDTAIETISAEMERMQRLQQQELLGKMAHSFVHEVNNPLSVILAFADIIKEDAPANSQIQHYAEDILHETNRIASFAAELLAFSRPSIDRMIPVEVERLIRSPLFLIRHIMNKAKVSLHITIQEKLPKIVCNPQLIQQVILNLLMNAVEAIEERRDSWPLAKQVKITATEFEEQGEIWIRFIIEDQGHGIDPALQEQIFTPFFTTKAPVKGGGLGLAVAKNIVEKHGGRLHFESKKDAYTRFFLDLQTQSALQTTPPAFKD